MGNAEAGRNDGRIEVGRFVARLIHFDVGWRYWAFAKSQHPNPLPQYAASDADASWGLDPQGYATGEEARRAMAKAESEADARIPAVEAKADEQWAPREERT